MTPRILVATRFGLGIKDPAWFEHRLVLLSAITAPSLMSQDDQNFEWVLRVDADLSHSVRDKLVEILSPFDGRAHICPNNHAELMALAETRGLVDRHGYLLVGRIDDDDAWAQGTVAHVRHRVHNWQTTKDNARGYGLTFESGLVWLMYDMIELDQLRKRGTKVTCNAAVRSYRYPFTSISEYTYSDARDGINALSTGHAELLDLMKSRGYMIDVVATSDPMWLYCRHKQADSSVDRGEGPNLDYDVPALEAMYGIDGGKTQEYIANSDRYGYGRIMQKFDKRGTLVRDIRAIDQKLRTGSADSEETRQLNVQRKHLVTELTELSERVTCSPGEVEYDD